MNTACLQRAFSDYPLMEPRDVIKLCYQSVFGCEHLLSDPEKPIAALKSELLAVPAEPDAKPFELIGGGHARLNLKSPQVRELSPEALVRMMQLSAHALTRTEEDLNACIALALQFAKEHPAGFSEEELRKEWELFCENGRQPVHHTEAYRRAYAPAYRVVLSDFAVLLPLIGRVSRMENVIVFLDGPCGSGKSTLAQRLADFYGIIPIHLDDFFLPPEMRTPERLAKAGENVHWERFLEEVLLPLCEGRDFCYHRFCCQTNAMETIEHPFTRVTLIEGSYSHHPAFRKAVQNDNALFVYLDISEEEQLARLKKRSPEKLPAFLTRWIPLEKKYFVAYDVIGQADLKLTSFPWEA